MYLNQDNNYLKKNILLNLITNLNKFNFICRIETNTTFNFNVCVLKNNLRRRNYLIIQHIVKFTIVYEYDKYYVLYIYIYAPSSFLSFFFYIRKKPNERCVVRVWYHAFLFTI